MDLSISNKNINELVAELPKLPTYKKLCIKPNYSKIPLSTPIIQIPLTRPHLTRQDGCH